VVRCISRAEQAKVIDLKIISLILKLCWLTCSAAAESIISSIGIVKQLKTMVAAKENRTGVLESQKEVSIWLAIHICCLSLLVNIA